MTEDDKAAGKQEASGASAPAAPQKPPAKWGDPIKALDHAWTRFELWLALVAFVLEASSMTVWVCLKGFSAPADHVSSTVFRGIAGATILGIGAHLGLAKQSEKIRRAGTLGAIVVGFAIARVWIHVGTDYASNLLNWYQQASFLTLLGGLRGVGTRLTMLLALLGGSLATARGRHIVIDIVTRFVSLRARTVMILTGWTVAAAVCFGAAWGFFDHIAIESFEASADGTPSAKIKQVGERLSEDLFIARKQIALDFTATPHVLFHGEVYSEWLTGKEWNAWVEGAGFTERYGKEAMEAVKIPETETRAPLVVVPGRGEPRGELINAAYLVFPIGLTIIGLRFIIRILLTLSGHFGVDSDESEEWSEYGRPTEEEG